MNYRLHRDGQNLGSFSLNELRRRRETGELNGAEYVWCEGMADWERLDSVLARSAPAGSPSLPPPIPASARKDGLNPTILVAIIFGVCLFVGGLSFVAYKAIKSGRSIFPVVAINRSQAMPHRSLAYIAASKPVVWTSNTWTAADVTNRGLSFRLRQWVEGYELRGDRTEACDADALRFLKAWVPANYTGDAGPNPPNFRQWSAKLANDPTCTDPLVLAAAGLQVSDRATKMECFERALRAFPASKHRAYPQLDATITLAKELGGTSPRVPTLDAAALDLLKQSFTDGSFQPDDQPEIAEILLHGWAQGFYSRNQAAVTQMTGTLGTPFQWLSLVLEGDHHISEAWKARGGGYADSVTAAGWQGFRSELAAARRCLTQAWELHPEYPFAPARMIYVSLGDSDITEMRLWFDRTVPAQIDYPEAWSNLRWGLRPRWYGDTESMLALGLTAVNTGRFDTAVPDELINVLGDLRQESPELTVAGLYGRPDVWPSVAKLYEGYIAAGPVSRLNDRRNTYCVLSYLTGKYDVARTQLEALNWKPSISTIVSQGQDPVLLPLEVAARTGSAATQVTRAESSRDRGDAAGAARIYADLLAGGAADDRTRQFARYRAATLALEQKLAEGGWVDLLPQSDHDPNWVFSSGDRRVTDRALDADPSGLSHYFFFSRTRIGRDFEVQGEFDVIQTPNRAFQAGVIMGVPDYSANLGSSITVVPGGGSQASTVVVVPGGVNLASLLASIQGGGVGLAAPPWYAFTVQRSANGRDTASFSRGLGTSGNASPAVLNDASNTFDVTLDRDLCSATVNGRVVFSNARTPQTVDNPSADFFLGVVGSTPVNEGVIRYRKLQVRKLPPEPAR